MRLFSNVWSENTGLFERLMEIHSNSPKLYYGFNEKHLPEWHFTCPKKKRDIFFCIESCTMYVHNILLACPIRELISWSFKLLARIWRLLAPGNGASVYVAPWTGALFYKPAPIQNHKRLKRECFYMYWSRRFGVLGTFYKVMSFPTTPFYSNYKDFKGKLGMPYKSAQDVS